MESKQITKIKHGTQYILLKPLCVVYEKKMKKIRQSKKVKTQSTYSLLWPKHEILFVDTITYYVFVA